MPQEIIHVGLTVSDLERSIAFYRDILGLRYLGELVMEGEATDRLFARSGCHVRVAYLNGGSGISAPPIELLEFVAPTSFPFHPAPSLFRPSISEVCFRIDDIDPFYRKLVDRGIEVLSPPQSFDFSATGHGKSQAFYFRDPDGIVLEAMEYVP